jgi:transcriptional regulator with XRE-family HTH domain
VWSDWRVAAQPDDSARRLRLEVGLQLRFHRHRAGLSQTQVAAATGWSLSAISMYEQGNRQAGYLKLRRLAELYGCSVEDFFHDAPDPSEVRLQQLEARVAELERLLADRAPARPRPHDEHSRVRGSEPVGHGRGRGF